METHPPASSFDQSTRPRFKVEPDDPSALNSRATTACVGGEPVVFTNVAVRSPWPAMNRGQARSSTLPSDTSSPSGWPFEPKIFAFTVDEPFSDHNSPMCCPAWPAPALPSSGVFMAPRSGIMPTLAGAAPAEPSMATVIDVNVAMLPLGFVAYRITTCSPGVAAVPATPNQGPSVRAGTAPVRSAPALPAL